jgi:hypothetical protein
MSVLSFTNPVFKGEDHHSMMLGGVESGLPLMRGDPLLFLLEDVMVETGALICRKCGREVNVLEDGTIEEHALPHDNNLLCEGSRCQYDQPKDEWPHSAR